MSQLKKERIKCWSYVLIWIFCIYSTLYIVRPLCTFLKENTPFNVIVNVGCFLILALLFNHLIQNGKIKRGTTYSLFFLSILLYAIGFLILEYPEERIHFIEYGMLAFLIFRALIIDTRVLLAYTSAFILTSLIGWGDEGIQYLLPNRYYQLNDVLLNSVGGALGLFLTYIFAREKQHNAEITEVRN